MLLFLFIIMLGLSSPFKPNKIKYSLDKLNALKKPNLKRFEDMDNFEKFEKFSEERNLEMQNYYLYKIYNQLNNITEPIYILDLDLENMISTMDTNIIQNVLKDIPKRPETKEEIADDSFEGYLQKEFNTIPKEEEDLINFEAFYEWRQKAGIMLTEDEVLFYYNLVVGEEQLCDVMQFIGINHLIDESDAPLY